MVYTEDLTIFDLKIGFGIKFYLYIQILNSIGVILGQNIKKLIFLHFYRVRFSEKTWSRLNVCVLGAKNRIPRRKLRIQSYSQVCRSKSRSKYIKIVFLWFWLPSFFLNWVYLIGSLCPFSYLFLV